MITQFITNSGDSTGDLTEIRRLCLHDGKIIENSKVELPGTDKGANPNNGHGGKRHAKAPKY
ncbi:hypothetical protein QBC43DRAFT_355068 [Cladorrhinum sp. PSN259]|nr:hypothetical protein QBC43DRAFT_355068 [Cladorrhinum sp. PSN259]